MNVEEFLRHELNRRQFLGSSAKNAAGVAAGMVGLSAGAAKAAPSERLAVGVVGVRNRGKVLAAVIAALPDVEVATLCDVDASQLPSASRAVQDAQNTAPRHETDFRHLLDDDSLDALVIATPDHWHAAMTILACEAGKHVFVETPIAHTIEEGRQMVAAARKHRRVVQAGLQQRSGTHFQSAVELMHTGVLGRVKLARAWTVHRRKSIGFKKDAPVPEGVDYDLWLGPAGKRPFNPNRFHHNWQWFWDYGSGELGNWGVHMLDLARWGLDVEWPNRIAATGGKLFEDDRQTPDTLAVHYSFPDKTLIWEHRLWSNRGIEGRSTAVAFYGENGTLIVDRGGWKVYDHKQSLTADSSPLDLPHLQNFVDRIKSGKEPTADIETGHVSSGLCHLGNMSYRLGREIAFDPQRFSCGDEEANQLL